MTTVQKKANDYVYFDFRANNTGNVPIALKAFFRFYPNDIPMEIKDIGTVNPGDYKFVNHDIQIPFFAPDGTYIINVELVNQNTNELYDNNMQHSVEVITEDPQISASIVNLDIPYWGANQVDVTLKNTGNVSHTFYVGTSILQYIEGNGCGLTGWGNVRDEPLKAITVGAGASTVVTLNFTHPTVHGDYVIVKVWRTSTPSDCLDGDYVQL